jgi:hypothetical protein
MTDYKKLASSTLAAFALVCSVASAHAEDFTATITSTETLIPQGTNKLCPARGMLSASGVATPLGSVQVFATDCVTVLSQGATLQFTQGRMVLTAEDGSGSVIANYQGFFDIAQLPPAQTNLYNMRDGTFTIIGGTGRYTKATGSGALTGKEHVNIDPTVPATGELQASGKIHY